MRSLKNFASVAAFALLTACAATPTLQSARPQNSTATGFSLAHSTLLDVSNYMLQPLDNDKYIIYSQNFGGGGAALGLLGPFGVAANISMIKSNTMNDVNALKDKIAIKPNHIFSLVVKNENFDVSENQGDGKTKITPYMYISKTEGEKLLIASAVLLEQGEGKNMWIGKYMYQLPTVTTISELSNLAPEATQNLSAALADGFKKIINKINTETPEQFATESKITFKSDFLTPRFDFEISGNLVEKTDDVTWIRTSVGVYGVRNTNISYKLIQK